jgi:hypothetical protein
MTKPTTASQRSKDILRALMDPSQPDAVPWSSSDLRAILEHQLATHLVSELDQFAEASQLSSDRVLGILEASGCRTFRDVLKNASESVDAVRLVKDLAKASLAHCGGLPRDVARVLYVLAILRGRQAGVSNLTSLDNVSLERETRRCLTFGWLPDEIRCLLRVNPKGRSTGKGF